MASGSSSAEFQQELSAWGKGQVVSQDNECPRWATLCAGLVFVICVICYLYYLLSCVFCVICYLDFKLSHCSCTIPCAGWFLTAWHKSRCVPRDYQPRNWFYHAGMAMSVGHFLDCLLTWEGPTHCGQYHPWAGGPGCFKKTGWASHENKPVSSSPPRAVSSSCLQVPGLEF